MKSFAAVAVLLLASSASADSRPITLTEAVAIARDGNDTRAAQAVAAERARVQVDAAESVDDLVIDATVEGLTRSTEPSAGPFFQETDFAAVSARVGVWKPLTWGGRVGVHVSDGISRTEALLSAGGPTSMLAYTVHNPRAELVWQQPLLRGRGRDVHDAGRRVARAGADAEAASLDLADTRLVLDVSRAYWELAYATREVAIRESSLALAGEQLTITRARVGAGKGAELEVLAVEQAVAAREAALVGAQQALGERALELRVLLALEDGDPRPLGASDALDAPTPPAPVSTEALAKTLAFAPELKVIDSRARGAEARTRAAKRGTGPQLDLLVRGGPTGNAAEAGAAFEQMATFDGYQAGASLSLTLPVGDRAARGEREMARLEQKQLAHLREASRGRLTAEVQRAVDAVALSDKRIAAAVRAAELAEKNVKLEIDRWKAGAGTNFDVLTRQDQKAAADAALARAHADRRIAVAALAALTGP
ncbi:MAG TPA: TolC family protein [Kofleriaceae bacterium]|nr:TolC family protein [Kofleriaceae bacterium]